MINEIYILYNIALESGFKTNSSEFNNCFHLQRKSFKTLETLRFYLKCPELQFLNSYIYYSHNHIYKSSEDDKEYYWLNGCVFIYEDQNKSYRSILKDIESKKLRIAKLKYITSKKQRRFLK